MGICDEKFFTRSLIVGNSCIWFSSIVILGLSVASVSYDVDTWLPFSYKPVLETQKVATAAVIISTAVLQLSALGWITLGYRREWQIKAYMLGNAVSSFLQMAIGISVLVIQKRAWPYFQLITLHLCFERFTHQRSSRHARSIDATTNGTTESISEGWLPTGKPSDPDRNRIENGFFNSLGQLPTKPGPEVPTECLPTDLLTTTGSLLIIAAIICAYLAFCSYHLWRHQEDISDRRSRRNTFSLSPSHENHQEIPPLGFGHPEKPPRNEPKTHQDSENSLS